MPERTKAAYTGKMRRLVVVVALLSGGLNALPGACQFNPCSPSKKSVDIVSRSVIRGSVNGSPLEAEVLATFNTRRGGNSTCVFSALPTGFTPGTLSVFE
jgi:hypothetical protein